MKYLYLKHILLCLCLLAGINIIGGKKVLIR